MIEFFIIIVLYWIKMRKLIWFGVKLTGKLIRESRREKCRVMIWVPFRWRFKNRNWIGLELPSGVHWLLIRMRSSKSIVWLVAGVTGFWWSFRRKSCALCVVVAGWGQDRVVGPQWNVQRAGKTVSSWQSRTPEPLASKPLSCPLVCVRVPDADTHFTCCLRSRFCFTRSSVFIVESEEQTRSLVHSALRRCPPIPICLPS